MKDRTRELMAGFFKENSDLDFLKDGIADSVTELAECSRGGRFIYVCGNGGSAADSEHISGELLKSFCMRRTNPSALDERTKKALRGMDGKMAEDLESHLQGGIRCIPLPSFTSFQTAFQNDCDGDYSFAQLVSALGKEGDALICISTSGNSRNVVLASAVAKAKGMRVISMTGNARGGGRLRDFSDIMLTAPAAIVHKAQEYHIKLYHLLCMALESEMFEE